MASIDRYYLKKRRRNVYVALEDMDFTWDEDEVSEFDRMWDEGLSVYDIARAFDRDPDEVALLVMDRVRAGMIEKRKNGIWGRRRREPDGHIRGVTCAQ